MILAPAQLVYRRPSEIDQAILDAEVAEAQARVQAAQRTYDDVKDGVDPENWSWPRPRSTKLRLSCMPQRPRWPSPSFGPVRGVVTALDLRHGEFVAPASRSPGSLTSVTGASRPPIWARSMRQRQCRGHGQHHARRASRR